VCSGAAWRLGPGCGNLVIKLTEQWCTSFAACTVRMPSATQSKAKGWSLAIWLPSRSKPQAGSVDVLYMHSSLVAYISLSPIRTRNEKIAHRDARSLALHYIIASNSPETQCSHEKQGLHQKRDSDTLRLQFARLTAIARSTPC